MVYYIDHSKQCRYGKYRPYTAFVPNIYFCGLYCVYHRTNISAFERQSRKRIESKEQDIQYREQLFSILSENIDDVFLMLNSKSYAVEYVTPNVNRVLGISKEEVTADLKTLGKAAYIGGKIISYSELDLMQPGQSIALESERTHRKTAEKRWFYESVYRVGDGQSDKFIVVLSDRTKDRQNKITLETALNAANAANRAKSTF